MTLNNSIKEKIKAKNYKVYNIFEMMYYTDEFDFFTVIMSDDTIFRLDSIEEFIEFYNLLKVNKNEKKL